MILFPIVFFLLPSLLLSLCLFSFSQSLTAVQPSRCSAALFIFSSSRLFFLSLSTLSTPLYASSSFLTVPSSEDLFLPLCSWVSPLSLQFLVMLLPVCVLLSIPGFTVSRQRQHVFFLRLLSPADSVVFPTC